MCSAIWALEVVSKEMQTTEGLPHGDWVSCSLPLLEANDVEIVSTSSFAPSKLFLIIEAFEADRAFASGLFAISILGALLSDLRWQARSMSKQLFQLTGQVCLLVLEVIRCLEDLVKNVDDVLTH